MCQILPWNRLLQYQAKKRNQNQRMSGLLLQSKTKKIEISSLKPQDHLVPVTDLNLIYPDIQNDFCNRHSILMGNLKKAFNDLYGGFQPSYYVIVKGDVQIIGTQDEEVELSMGLENGIIALVSTTFQKQNIYINGNHIDEELIFNHNGIHQQGLNQYLQQMKKICFSAVSSTSQQLQAEGIPLFGGIIYIHANIPEGFYNYKNSLLTALFLSLSIINNRLPKYTISQLITKISETQEVDQQFLERQFYDYENRQLSLMVRSVIFKEQLNKDLKLLFCRLDLADCDIKQSQKNIEQIKQGKSRMNSFLAEKYGVKSLCDAFENQMKIDVDLQQIGQITRFGGKEQEIIKIIDAQFRELKIMCQFSNGKISFEDLIKNKWIIDSQMRCIFSQEVVELVESIKQKMRIQACTIVCQEFLMLVVQKNQFTQNVCGLRQLLHRGELKSKSCFKLEEQLVEHRWGEDSQIGEKIFISVPSKGIGIFQPSNAIWFE